MSRREFYGDWARGGKRAAIGLGVPVSLTLIEIFGQDPGGLIGLAPQWVTWAVLAVGVAFMGTAGLASLVWTIRFRRPRVWLQFEDDRLEVDSYWPTGRAVVHAGDVVAIHKPSMGILRRILDQVWHIEVESRRRPVTVTYSTREPEAEIDRALEAWLRQA